MFILRFILRGVNMPESAKLYNIDILSEKNIQINVLPHYNLENSVIESIKFKDTEKQRAVYKVSTPKERFCLKKVYFNEKELLFVYSAIEWLKRNGIKVPKILPNKYNGRYVEYAGMLFILTPWIEGIKCDYGINEHIEKASYTLGKVHITSSKFFPIQGSADRIGCTNLYESITRHFERLLTNSNIAFKYGDTFSKIFLGSFDRGLSLAKTALQYLSITDFSKLEVSLCHMDYVSKNLIMDKSEDIWIIDFDKCRIDYCIYDLAYFLRRLSRRDRINWDLSVVLNFLESYERVRSLNIHEYRYLLGYLAFPQKYWKISRDYYRNINKCNKPAFINMLKKSIKNLDAEIKFVEDFANHINKKFNVQL